MEKGKILIADDEPAIRRVISILLKEEGYETKAVENGRLAVEELQTFQPDIVLLDQQMPVMTGTEAMEEIRKIKPDQPIIFVTAFGSISMAVEAVKNGAYDFIEKPFDNDNLIQTVNRALEHSRMKTEIIFLKKQLTGNDYPMIGNSAGLRRLTAQIKKVSETEATVLVNGESGTGKELIARNIHFYSKRSEKPFIAVNCGAIPLSLMESELFGHEKGAFTDAKEQRQGIFEQATGGTLFLDELGELPMDAQVKLLRVLEERKVTRLGGKKSIPVDVRIIAATNRNLEEEVKKGNFRLDLFYRLNVFAIHIPPLRERKEDIPLLIDHFITRYNRRLNLHVNQVSKEAIDLFCSYEWPGNIRDLENAVQSAMILTGNDTIAAEHLPVRLKGYESFRETTEPEIKGKNIREVNARVEKEIITDTLRKNNFSRTLTAKELNISRKTLFNKMKKYGLDI